MFDLNYHQKYSQKNNLFIAGCDEVGRGPLAGPVVAACASLHQKNYDSEEFSEVLELLNFRKVLSNKMDEQKDIIWSDAFKIN